MPFDRQFVCVFVHFRPDGLRAEKYIQDAVSIYVYTNVCIITSPFISKFETGIKGVEYKHIYFLEQFWCNLFMEGGCFSLLNRVEQISEQPIIKLY